MSTQKKGFTLVELSIVLVIIGLLIGGVLKGQSMIENAKLKRVKTDIDGIVSAAYGYQDKYNALPGDDSIDRSVELGATGCNGTQANAGNGQWNNATEYACAWQELIGAGFVAGDKTLNVETTVAKKSPFGGAYLFRTGTQGSQNGNYIFVQNVPSDKVQALDQKYDDGVWNTGVVQANAAYPAAGAAAANRNMYWFAF